MTRTRTPEQRRAAVLRTQRWREANRDKAKQINRNWDARRIADIAAHKDRPCMDCGGVFPTECMDFDHVRGDKKFTISVQRRRPWQEVLDEIAKCDVVCANCHRIRTKRRMRECAIEEAK